MGCWGPPWEKGSSQAVAKEMTLSHPALTPDLSLAAVSCLAERISKGV